MNKIVKTETASSRNTTEKLLKEKPKLAIEYRSIATLRFDPKNPRLHDQKQIRQIASSIEAFGFNTPILIDAELRVVAGHGRLQACKRLGLTEVPTIRLEHLTEAQTRAFMIADNRLTENSVWDEHLLGEQFKALSVLDLDFSIDVTGFEMGEIEMMIEGLAPASTEVGSPADAIPEATRKAQVTRAGFLWHLDRHRIYCGDARTKPAYSLLMQGRRAAAVFTDLAIENYFPGSGKLHRVVFPKATREIPESKSTTFLTLVLLQLARHSKDGALHFICTDWRHAPELLDAASEAYSEFKDLCVWVKDIAGPGSIYRGQHELIFVFKSGKRAHRDSVQHGQFGRARTNVWQYRSANSLADSRGETSLSDHCANIKPVELVADAIQDCTSPGEVVLDSFLCTGTTVIAAERAGRICYGMELDPAHVDTAIRRWQVFTGKSAIQESTGHTFNELEEKSHEREK